MGGCSVGRLGEPGCPLKASRRTSLTPVSSPRQAAGGLFVPLLHSLPVKEMAYVVRKSGAKRLIVCETLAAKGDELAAETGCVLRPSSKLELGGSA